mmetsp:Transcript_7192/g.21939  ORF Transcript_7192/g.21939 Transcript_7192/m.21939 type:complete len:204 (+) Transcript_7192:420-1031(+)
MSTLVNNGSLVRAFGSCESSLSAASTSLNAWHSPSASGKRRTLFDLIVNTARFVRLEISSGSSVRKLKLRCSVQTSGQSRTISDISPLRFVSLRCRCDRSMMPRPCSAHHRILFMHLSSSKGSIINVREGSLVPNSSTSALSSPSSGDEATGCTDSLTGDSGSSSCRYCEMFVGSKRVGFIDLRLPRFEDTLGVNFLFLKPSA